MKISKPRVAIFSDLHLGVHSNSSNWHNYAVEWAHWCKDECKGKISKIRNFNAMNVPCSNLEFGQLRDGASLEVEDEVADKMLAMGIVEKINKKTKKAKKGD